MRRSECPGPWSGGMSREVTTLAETPTPDDERGITCVVYNAGVAPHALDDLDKISDVIADGSGFVWLDIAQPSPEDLAMLGREFEIHPMALEDASLWHE